MEISVHNQEKAKELLSQIVVADLHLDLPGELLYRHKNGEKSVIQRKYLPAWKAAGMHLLGASVYIEDECLPDGGFENAMEQIVALQEEMTGTDVFLVRCRADLQRAYQGNGIGIILYMEGLDFIKSREDISLLEQLWKQGVRGASLTWSRDNVLARGCCRASENKAVYGGITPVGLCVIEEMKRLHMFLDISHMNDDGIRDILEKAELPVLATHSNARSVCAHYRNLTDEQLTTLSQRQGIAGLNACMLLTGAAGNRSQPIEALVEQITYLRNRMGEKQVCLGLDLCDRYEAAECEWKACKPPMGQDSLVGHEELYILVAALLENGWSEEQLCNMLGKNAFTFLEKALP